MLGAVYYGVENIRVEEIKKPEARENNIIIKVICCLICGTDLKIYLQGNPKVVPPRVLGHELVGIVEHIGTPVEGLKIGDRIVVATTISCGKCEYCKKGLGNMCPNATPVGIKLDGAFAEYFEFPVSAAHHLIKVPDDVKSEAAAICEPLSCAINGHEKINVSTGDNVAIIGGGPLGAIHAELAKAEGAARVFLIEVARERLELLKTLDNVTLIDSSSESAEELIKEATNGLGADKVIVCAPAAPAFLSAFSLVRKGGSISYFASLPKGNSMLTIDSREIHYNELIIAGVSDSRPEHVQKAIDYLAEHKINTDSIITHRVKLKDFMTGMDWMKNRQCLKVAVYPDESYMGE